MKKRNFWPFLVSFAIHLFLVGATLFLVRSSFQNSASLPTTIDTDLSTPEKSERTRELPTAKSGARVTQAATPVTEAVPGVPDSMSISPENSSKNDQPALSDSSRSYFSTLRSQIADHKIYPILARKQGLEGVVEVAIELNTDGSLQRISPISGLNHAILVEAAVQAIQAAAPFSAVPKGFPQRVVVPIEFMLHEKK